jgi:4-hydroxy-3-polyprenylbenzoate decarboxylase
MDRKKRIVICISGASGVGLGLKLYSLIPEKYEKYLILSKHAQVVLEKEEGVYWEDDISAPPASGSFGADITFITPTSMNTLAKIATGIEDNLITRVAAVAIKERKPLLLAPREIPFPLLHLEHMAKLARFPNVIIAPPVVTYYTFPNTLQEMEHAIIGRWMDLVGIENELYRRWRDDEEKKRRELHNSSWESLESEEGEELEEEEWKKEREASLKLAGEEEVVSQPSKESSQEEESSNKKEESPQGEKETLPTSPEGEIGKEGGSENNSLENFSSSPVETSDIPKGNSDGTEKESQENSQGTEGDLLR